MSARLTPIRRPIRRPGAAWRGHGPARAAPTLVAPTLAANDNPLADTRPLRLLHGLVSLLCVTLSVGMVVAVLWSIPS